MRIVLIVTADYPETSTSQPRLSPTHSKEEGWESGGGRTGGWRSLPLCLFTTHRLREQKERARAYQGGTGPGPSPHSDFFKVLDVHNERFPLGRQCSTSHNKQIKRDARKKIHCSGQQRPPRELQKRSARSSGQAAGAGCWVDSPQSPSSLSRASPPPKG